MTIFKQYDSRWGKKNYNGSSSIAAAACGPFSVANVLVEHNPKIDPMEVVKFMQKNGYAIRNKGTAWSGIPAALKYFGMADVKAVNVGSTMNAVWEHMAKGYDAVFLFKDGSKGGVCWTTAGHYVAMTDYKVKDGKHYLKAKDSGGRDHDGWYCYETQMKGLIPKVWVAKAGAVPLCIDVSEHQGSIDWVKVKKSGINHAIIRAGYGKCNIDKWWKANITGAIKAGIQNIGVYWFSYAYTSDMARNEADYLITAITPYKEKINLGLWYDYEYDSAKYAKKHKVKVTRAHVTALHKAFCGRLEQRGYKAGFYYSYDYKKNYIDLSVLPYRNWYALYDTSDKQTDCYLQQYSSKGRVNGISGNVDMNWLFGAEPGKKKNGLDVDGIPGAQTYKAFQKWLGITQTGLLDKPTIKAFQKRMNIPDDGIWGPHTSSALQRYLNMKINAGLKVDGKCGSLTIKALQRFLNKEVFNG